MERDAANVAKLGLSGDEVGVAMAAVDAAAHGLDQSHAIDSAEHAAASAADKIFVQNAAASAANITTAAFGVASPPGVGSHL